MKRTSLVAACMLLCWQATLAGAAVLDITNNALVIDFPAGGTNPETTIRAEIISGRGKVGLGALWNGASGITSSTAAADAATSINSTSVAYAHNAGLPLGAYTSFRGQAVDPSSVLIAYTRTGDANLDGVVGNDDVAIVGANYAPGFSRPFWALGDFDYNGFVDNDDITLLGAFYNPAATPLPAPAMGGTLSAVPEPQAIALAIAALMGLALLTATRRFFRRRVAVPAIRQSR